MNSVKEKITRFTKDNLDSLIEEQYLKTLKNKSFKILVEKLNVRETELMKNSSKLKKTVHQLENCKGCKNLFECKNEVEGFVYYPEILNDKLLFSYISCKHKKKNIVENKYLENIYSFGIPSVITEAKMKNIHLDDKGRLETIKWLKDFVLAYKRNQSIKGLYLYGSFGCGKTYLVAAALNELAKRKSKYAVVYWPEFLRMLKSSFDNNTFGEKFDDIKESEILFIDDIGAEATTAWGRDEILGPILQYRMENKLTTFLTSNLSLKDLEVHLSVTNNNVDGLKAQRIIERIKELTEEKMMISENKRGN